jgi:GDP-L-fucose synthase
MNKQAKIFIAGHNGLVGSAIKRLLEKKGYSRLITAAHQELDLERQTAVESFFAKEQPEYVFLAAAKVGGILANKTFPAEFIYSNLAVQTNVIHSAHKYGVKKLLFLGSSCIYPRQCPQPIKEDYLLTSPLESTNEAYAIAKIAGLKMCRYYRQQYGCDFISVMPTNLYGPNDNYDLENSHVLPALLRKMHLGKCLDSNNMDEIRNDLKRFPFKHIHYLSNEKDILAALADYGISKTKQGAVITLWGSGSPKREFLHVDDLANAVIYLFESYSAAEIGETINIGCGEDVSIRYLAEMIQAIVRFQGKIHWDDSKPDGTPQKLLDISRLKSLGWSPEIPLLTGIQETYRQLYSASYSAKE